DGCIAAANRLELDLVVVELAIEAGVGERVDRLLGGRVAVGRDFDRLGALILFVGDSRNAFQDAIDSREALAAAEVRIGNSNLRFSEDWASQQQRAGQRDERTHESCLQVGSTCRGWAPSSSAAAIISTGDRDF